ncbi:MAG: hypothetical protein KKB21_00860 [Nanoarchaeota archaeon]|nr:hypothetical protein [Nanoarchaeota archaeon]MBU4086106.1 hypothetical protein [Nanoarchaeota archaeon]
MQIIGFNFTKISSERKKNPSGKMEIKSNINLKNISQEKVDLIKDKDVLKFEFEFKIDYSPDIAIILFEGSILAIVDKETQKDVLKKWKTKKISDEVRLPLFNTILAKCNLKSLQLEDEFNLPMHVPMPRLSPPQEKGYVQ